MIGLILHRHLKSPSHAHSMLFVEVLFRLPGFVEVLLIYWVGLTCNVWAIYGQITYNLKDVISPTWSVCMQRCIDVYFLKFPPNLEHRLPYYNLNIYISE